MKVTSLNTIANTSALTEQNLNVLELLEHV